MAGNETTDVRKGLKGVKADETAISTVDPDRDTLLYRGYPIEELAARCSFEEVVHLLVEGDLPSSAQLEAFRAKERGLRKLSDRLHEVIARFPASAHPMDTLRTGVSFLGLEAEGVKPGDPPTRTQAVELQARIPTIIAAARRRARGEAPIGPREDLGIAANFFWMCFGELPDDKVVAAFDTSLILYAEHSFNASAFVSRVVLSTESDLFGATTAAIAALKGPLHGGANEAVVRMLEEVARPENAVDWVRRALDEGRKIMGFGHRVYQNGDSRVPPMRQQLDRLAEVRGERGWLELVDAVERAMDEAKGIFPNLDFPAGAAYRLMGFETPLFTPIFVLARMSGWSAHALEQAAHNALIRPVADYTGPGPRAVRPIEER